MLGEVYWDRESRLHGLGFDCVYDKVFLDRLLTGTADGVLHHLRKEMEFQRRCCRFIENCQEMRSLCAFRSLPQTQAGATLALLSPGLRLISDGQPEGYNAHHSMHSSK